MKTQTRKIDLPGDGGATVVLDTEVSTFDNAAALMAWTKHLTLEERVDFMSGMITCFKTYLNGY